MSPGWVYIYEIFDLFRLIFSIKFIFRIKFSEFYLESNDYEFEGFFSNGES